MDSKSAEALDTKLEREGFKYFGTGDLDTLMQELRLRGKVPVLIYLIPADQMRSPRFGDFADKDLGLKDQYRMYVREDEVPL